MYVYIYISIYIYIEGLEGVSCTVLVESLNDPEALNLNPWNHPTEPSEPQTLNGPKALHFRWKKPKPYNPLTRGPMP